MRVFYKVDTGAHEFLHMAPLNKSLSPSLSNFIGSQKLRGATACSISIGKTEEKRRGNGTRYSRSGGAGVLGLQAPHVTHTAL